jgi:ketosteroid isomerase-like protein
MHFYTGDAALVVKPGLNASGKAQIPKAFAAIADFLKHKITVWQGEMKVIEGPDTALVIMETVLNAVDADGAETSVVRRASRWPKAARSSG